MSQSLILSETPTLQSMMGQVLAAAPHKPSNISGLGLLYRGSRDGFNAAAFHQACDNQGPTLTLIRARDGGFVFGAYLDVPWTSDNVWLKKGEANPWVFSLRNPKGVQPLLMVPNDVNPQCLVHRGAGNGPIIGNVGFYVRDAMTTASNECHMKTYKLVSDVMACVA